MNRVEFSSAVKQKIIARATRAGVVYCEECGNESPKGYQIDHTTADALKIEKRKLTEKDGRLLCKGCHAEKTAVDVPAIAQAKRRQEKRLGLGAKKQPIKSPGFVKTEKATKTSRHPILPRRSLFAPSPTREFDDDSTD